LPPLKRFHTASPSAKSSDTIERALWSLSAPVTSRTDGGAVSRCAMYFSLRALHGGLGIESASVQPSTIARTSSPNRSRSVARSCTALPLASLWSSIASWSSAATASFSLAPCSIAIAATERRWER